MPLTPRLVEDCTIHDNGGDGIDLNSRDREGNATGVIVRRNRVVRNHLTTPAAPPTRPPMM